MKERILHFLSIEHISPAHFADLIGVQRSSVSHILSGRNNPGLEFIQKILNAYPKLNSEWLIMGKGDMLKQAKQGSLFDSQLNPIKDEKAVILKEIGFINSSEKNDQRPETPNMEGSSETENKNIDTMEIQDNKFIGNRIGTQKNLEKVLFIYSDSSFEVFYPAQKS